MKSWGKIRDWSRLFSEYAIAQAAIQLVGILAGLWLVNLLPVREYALYTFALSLLTFLSVFSDLGVTSALLYFRRETRIAGSAFSPYVQAAYKVRYGLLALGACAGLAFMAMIGHDRGIGTAEIAVISAVLVVAVSVQVGSSIALLQLRLEGLYRESYLAEMSGNAVRLLFVAAMWFAATPFAWLAMLAGAVGSLVTRIAAGGRRPAAANLPGVTRSDSAPLEGIVRYVLPMSVSAVYFSIQAPLTVWLSAYFAGTDSVAEVGALGRLGILFGLLSGFIGTVLMPRLSVVTDDSHYLRRYLQCWTILVGFGVAVILAAYAVPECLLFLLGDAYSGLATGVLLIAISSVLSTWGGYAVAINNARGWIRFLPMTIMLFASIQVFLIAVLDLSSTIGVLYYGLWSNLAGLLLQVTVNAAGLIKPQLVSARK